MNVEVSEKRRGPVLLIVCTLIVVLSPIAQNWSAKPKDNFPLSYYPMFSALREAEYSTPTLVALNPEGKATVLSYELVGSGGFNEVRRQVRSRIAKNKAKSLCRKLARRVAREEDLRSLDLSSIQIITATHNIDAYFAGNKTPVKQKVHASCPVKEEVSAEVRP
jgi:hypothetical protein